MSSICYIFVRYIVKNPPVSMTRVLFIGRVANVCWSYLATNLYFLHWDIIITVQAHSFASHMLNVLHHRQGESKSEKKVRVLSPHKSSPRIGTLSNTQSSVVCALNANEFRFFQWHCSSNYVFFLLPTPHTITKNTENILAEIRLSINDIFSLCSFELFFELEKWI